MDLIKNLCFIALLLFIVSCEGDVINPFDDSNDEPNSKEILGLVELPSSIDANNLTVVTPIGTSRISEDGSFKTAASSMEKEVFIVENQLGEFLMGSFHFDEDVRLNANSTARVIIGMAPWTAHLGHENLVEILNDLSQTPIFLSFEEAISNSIQNGVSPLRDEDVIDLLLKVLRQDEGLKSASFSSMQQTIPDVDYIVEPRLQYSNKNLSIGNDGTTSSVWGLEVFHENSSITGELLLEGNAYSFPSLGSLWDLIKGDFTSSILQESEPILLPITIEDKYELQFCSPFGTLNRDISNTVVLYNLFASYKTVCDAFGLDLKIFDASTYFDEGCTNALFNAVANTIVNTGRDGKLTGTFLFNQVQVLFSGVVQSMDKCTDEFNLFDGADVSQRQKYLKHLVKFLDVYSKAEAIFITSKLAADMLVINDIRICRQFIEGNMYPCFTLQKNPSVESKTHYKGDVKIELKAQTDFPNEDNTFFPEGAPIHWEITSGDGSLDLNVSYVKSDGISEVILSTGDDLDYTITASILSENGSIQDFVEYKIAVKDLNYRLEIGDYNPTYENINPIQSYANGDVLVLPNGLKQMVRLTLDGEVVSGGYGGGWKGYPFGYSPASTEDTKDDHYGFNIYDAVNGRDVQFNFKFTGSNAAYRKIVGSTISVGKESSTENLSKLAFSKDGTYTFTYYDGSDGGGGSYDFFEVIAHSYVNCNEFYITKPKVGCIHLSGGSSGGSPFPEYIMIYEDGTLSANSFYGCPDRYYSWILR